MCFPRIAFPSLFLLCCVRNGAEAVFSMLFLWHTFNYKNAKHSCATDILHETMKKAQRWVNWLVKTQSSSVCVFRTKQILKRCDKNFILHMITMMSWHAAESPPHLFPNIHYAPTELLADKEYVWIDRWTVQAFFSYILTDRTLHFKVCWGLNDADKLSVLNDFVFCLCVAVCPTAKCLRRRAICGEEPRLLQLLPSLHSPQANFSSWTPFFASLAQQTLQHSIVSYTSICPHFYHLASFLFSVYLLPVPKGQILFPTELSHIVSTPFPSSPYPSGPLMGTVSANSARFPSSSLRSSLHP